MNVYTLVPLASFIGFGALVVIVLSHRPLLLAHKIFASMLFFTMVWSFSSFILHANFFPQMATWWYISLSSTMLVSLAFYYHFSRVFAGKPADWSVYLSYSTVFILIMAIASGYYVQEVYVVDSLVYVAEENVVVYGLMGFISLSLIGGVIFNFATRLRSLLDNPRARNQASYLVVAVSIAVILNLSNLMPDFRGYPIDQAGMLINCLIIAYAILRYQLLSIRIIARSALSYISFIALVGVAWWFGALLAGWLFHFDVDIATLAAGLVLSVVAALLLFPPPKIFQNFVDRLFYGRESQKYRLRLFDFVSRRVSGVFNLEELGKELLPSIVKALNCQRAQLLLPETGGDFVTKFAEPYEKDGQRLRVKRDSPILEWLKRENRCLTRENLDSLPEFHGLWDIERDQFSSLNLKLFFPLVSRGNLIGTLVLAERNAGNYLLDDINLIESIVNQVAVSVEKEYLREQLIKREKELSLVNRLASVITSSLNIQEIYDTFVTELKEVVDVEWATIALTEGGELYFQALSTEIGTPWQTGEKIPLKGTATEWVVSHKKYLVEFDLDSKSKFWTGELHRRQGVRSIAYLPLLVKDEVIGSLIVGSRRPNAYSLEQLNLLERLAHQISMPAENARLYSRAEQRARVDELTGLFNRRHFDETLGQEIDRHSRYGGKLSLLLIDLDNFKGYNDTLGHLAGDKLLAQIGQLIKGPVRSVDITYRYGGDEFAVILPQSSSEEAFGVAERIRELIAAEMASRQIAITASIGLASWPSEALVPDEIVNVADSALYYAKRTGRNRTYVASKMLPSVTEPAVSRTHTEQEALNTIYALAATIEARDPYTYGHSQKVGNYAVALAEAIGLPSAKVATVSTAALLHDIGKIGIADAVLNKDARLDNDEWELIRSHPKLSATIVGHVQSLTACLPAILHHHERWDGSGYPAGLKGEDIPLEARILAVADSFDAMTSSRPYRNAISCPEALEELKRGAAGGQFDPELVGFFLPIALATAPVELSAGQNTGSRETDK